MTALGAANQHPALTHFSIVGLETSLASPLLAWPGGPQVGQGREAQGPVEAQLFGAEAGEAASPSASSPTVSCSALAEALPQEALNEMLVNLTKFLALQVSGQGAGLWH